MTIEDDEFIGLFEAYNAASPGGDSVEAYGALIAYINDKIRERNLELISLTIYKCIKCVRDEQISYEDTAPEAMLSMRRISSQEIIDEVDK